MAEHGHGLSEDEYLAREAVTILSSVQRKIAAVWERPADDATVCFLTLAAALDTNSELVELKLPKPMATRLVPSMEKLKSDPSEITLLLVCASRRRNTACNTACANTLVSQRIEAVAKALDLTLKETRPAQAWSNGTTRLACVLAFHGTNSPLPVLTALFGVINKSDERRAEDLHDTTCGDPLDAYTQCVLLEAVCESLVLN